MSTRERNAEPKSPLWWQVVGAILVGLAAGDFAYFLILRASPDLPPRTPEWLAWSAAVLLVLCAVREKDVNLRIAFGMGVICAALDAAHASRGWGLMWPIRSLLLLSLGSILVAGAGKRWALSPWAAAGTALGATVVRATLLWNWARLMGR
jgi:hypothetical protein